MRNTVSELGRFITLGGGMAGPMPATTTAVHYRLRLWRRQRPERGFKRMKEQYFAVNTNE